MKQKTYYEPLTTYENPRFCGKQAKFKRGFNRGFSIFFNIENVLFCFTKL